MAGAAFPFHAVLRFVEPQPWKGPWPLSLAQHPGTVSLPPKLAGKSQRIQLNGWGKVGSSVRSSPGLQSSHAPNPNFSCQAFLTAWWDAAWCGGHKGILVMPLLALIYSLTLGKSLHVSGPEHPYLQNSTSSICKALWCKDESCHLRDM